MTNGEKKRLLSEYLDMKEECKILQETYRELRSTLESVQAQQLSDMPKGSPVFDKIGEKLGNLDIQYNKYCRMVDLYLAIERSIFTLTEINLRNLMRLRYIEGHCWEKVAEILNKDRATVYRWHDKAIELIEIKKDPLS